MEAALNLHPRSRGDGLLLHHCESLGRCDDGRLPAAARLEQALGPELTRLLLRALVRGPLAPPQGRPATSSSP